MLNIRTNISEKTLVQVDDKLIMVELICIEEGYGGGGYDANDSKNKRLLRFNVYINANYGQTKEADWVGIEDASACTNISANSETMHILERARDIHKAFRKEITGYPLEKSVKMIAEEMSYLD